MIRRARSGRNLHRGAGRGVLGSRRRPQSLGAPHQGRAQNTRGAAEGSDERVWAALEALATTGFDAVKLETLSEPEDDEEEDQLPVARARKVVASLGAKVTMPPAWAKALRRRR